MENLPVKLLTELITTDEIIAAKKVMDTHEVSFCPVGVSMPECSRVALKYHCGEEQLSEFRYTPRAYFAIKVWETARDNLLKSAEFAGALDVEWYPVAATFRSVRYVKGSPERFVAAMFAEMKRLADSHAVDVRYGRFDMPALPERPGYPRRFYILPPEIFAEKRGWGMTTETQDIQDSPAGEFMWKDIEDAFVVLKPIQLAFIAGDEMNNHTPLDDEFIDACAEFNFEKVKELVRKGANIHSADQYGDTAMDVMMMSYHTPDEFDEQKRVFLTNKNHDDFIKIARYLLSLGYNINISGYCASTCLYDATFVEDADIIKFLLDNGANPNLGSFIGEEGAYGVTALSNAWDDEFIDEEQWYEELTMLLLRHGALPVTEEARFTAEELDAWIDERKAASWWDSSIYPGLSKFDAALVHCAQCMNFYYMALIAQSGGDISVRDERGRNLLQIVLEWQKSDPDDPRQQRDLAEMSLMLLCGLKLKLSDAEIERAKATCREKGYTEALEAIISVTAP